MADISKRSPLDGAHGTVTFELRDGKPVAVKTMPMNEGSLAELYIAIDLQGHPGIIPILEHSFSNNQVKMVFPYIPETVLDRVQQTRTGLPVKLVHRLLSQLLAAVEYIHSKGYVHQDIKLENILIDAEDNIYLIDFGFSRQYKPGVRSFRHNCGSTHYAAPEIWLQKQCEGPEVDIWSLGVSTFLMATSYFPFGGDCPAQVWSSIRKGISWLPKSLRRNPLLSHLIHQMLSFNGNERITLPEILEHPWIVSESFPLHQSSSEALGRVDENELPKGDIDETEEFKLDHVEISDQKAVEVIPVAKQRKPTSKLGKRLRQFLFRSRSNSAILASARNSIH